MAQKIEKLEQDTLDKIIKYQSEANKIIFEIGQISIQNRELELQIKKMNEYKISIGEKFDNIGLQLENILSDLQKKYPGGEINLEEGTVNVEITE
jgi:hypothetical protein